MWSHHVYITSIKLSLQALVSGIVKQVVHNIGSCHHLDILVITSPIKRINQGASKDHLDKCIHFFVITIFLCS